MTAFAANLKRIRRERGLTQTALSHLIGKSSCVVAQYESGHRKPGLDNLERLAHALGVSMGSLIGQGVPVAGMTGPLAERLAAAWAELRERDREIVVVMAEWLSLRAT